MVPGLRLTPPVLEFGDVVTNAYADHLIVALNTSSTLPLKYKVGEGRAGWDEGRGREEEKMQRV